VEGKRRSSRERLQEAAKSLFAERGYETTTVAAIVKLARTSYSQFIAHFTDKAGVLSAILRDGWTEIASAIRLATSRISSPLDKLKLTVDVVISYLERDHAFRTLFLMERATTRRNGTRSHNEGFRDFMKILDGIFAEMLQRGDLSADVNPQVLRSALMGALEGMLRDQLLGGQAAASYSESAIRLVFSNFMASALATKKPQAPVMEAPEAAIDELAEAGLEVPPGDQRWINRYLNLAAIALGPPGNA
jgi:AcrR family transcriptional regulator